MAELLMMFALVFLPALLLLFFSTRKDKRLIWFTIPATVCGFLICFWGVLANSTEYQGLFLLMLVLHTAAVSAVTAGFALIQNKWGRRALTSVVVLCCAVGVVYAGNSVLQSVSDSYRQNFDRDVFTQLCEIKPEDIESIEVFDIAEKTGETSSITDYHGDKTFFSSLEYTGSLLSKSGWEHKISVDIVLIDGSRVLFTYYSGDDFQVQYKDRSFYIKSPQLLSDIKDDSFVS